MTPHIDLHLHTRYSDGHWTPPALFDALVARGVRVASVTDHDQLDHLREVEAIGARRGITVIPGTEVTTEWRGLPAHILCYAAPATGFTTSALRTLVNGVRAEMLANTALIMRRLRERGYVFPRQSEILAEQGGQPIRAGDVARLLREDGHADTLDVAMSLVVEAGYRQATAPLAEVVAATHASGGVCLLAHPGRGEGEIHQYAPEEIEVLLGDVPLDGLEVYYPAHTEAQIAAYLDLTRRYSLLVSAGSDSHGPRQRLPIAYPATDASALLAWLGIPLPTV